MKRTVAVVSAALSSLLLLTGAPRAAHGDMNGLLGGRLGLTDDPSPLQVGIFYEIPIATAGSGFFAIEPGADLGFDLEDNISFWTLRGTVNGKYLVPVNNRFLYPIFGLSLWYSRGDCGGRR